MLKITEKFMCKNILREIKLQKYSSKAIDFQKAPGNFRSIEPFLREWQTVFPTYSKQEL